MTILQTETRQPYTAQRAETVRLLRAAAELVDAGEANMEHAILAARGHAAPDPAAPLALRGLHIMRANHCPTVRVLREYLRYLHRDDTASASLLRNLADEGKRWNGVTLNITTYVNEDGLTLIERRTS